MPNKVQAKNKKKYWRKYASRADTTKILRDLEKEDVATAAIKQKPDSQLFFIDKLASDSLSTVANPQHIRRPQPHPACWGNLNIELDLLPAIKPKSSRKQEDKTLHKIGKHMNTKKINLKRALNKPAFISRKSSSDNSVRKNQKTQFYNMWVEDQQCKSTDAAQAKNRARHCCAPDPSLLPKVELPHPGSSYNPALDDHQELLAQAVAHEMSRDSYYNRLHNKLDALFPHKSEAPTEAMKAAEMCEGLFSNGDDTDSDEFVKQENSVLNTPPTDEARTQIKDTKSKRKRDSKQRRAAELARKAKELKAKREEVHLLKQAGNAKTISKQIKRQLETEELQRQQRSNARRLRLLTKPRKFGRFCLADATLNDGGDSAKLAVKAPDELHFSLRSLKPEGQLLAERLASMQCRNLLEVRVPAQHRRKYAKKMFDRFSKPV